MPKDVSFKALLSRSPHDWGTGPVILTIAPSSARSPGFEKGGHQYARAPQEFPMFPVPEGTFLQDSLQTGRLLGLSNRGDLSQDCPPRPPAVLQLFPPSDPSPVAGRTENPPAPKGLGLCLVSSNPCSLLENENLLRNARFRCIWRWSAQERVRTAAARGDGAPDPPVLLGRRLSVCYLSVALSSLRGRPQVSETWAAHCDCYFSSGGINESLPLSHQPVNTQGPWCPGLASQGTEDGHHGDSPPGAGAQLAHVTVRPIAV